MTPLPPPASSFICSRGKISSLPADAERIAQAVRSHWEVENRLHWCLDVQFNDDQSRLRTGFAANNLAIVRHIVMNLLRLNTSRKGSIKTKRMLAATLISLPWIRTAFAPSTRNRPSVPWATCPWSAVSPTFRSLCRPAFPRGLPTCASGSRRCPTFRRPVSRSTARWRITGSRSCPPRRPARGTRPPDPRGWNPGPRPTG